MSIIFLLPVCLTYWPRKYTTRVDPHVDNSHQVSSWYDHTLPSYSVFVCWYVTWPCDFDFWPFDLEQLPCIAGHITWSTLPRSLKTLCLSVLDLWVITFPVGYHWKCVCGHCACAESRDPWVGGQKQLNFWNPRPRFAYSLYNFYWATTTIKGRLLSSRPMLKTFSGEKNSKSRRNGAPKWRFFGKMGVQTLDIGFATPKRHSLAQNRAVWRILRQNRCARLGGSLSQVLPKNSQVTLCRGARNHACAEPKPLNRFR